ncbi:hypothetical protein PQX77_014810 [Marasmius sp. AFHP31]|nr:hypothetical protein PQX77_014810 [Marasmius sp. AFHP31]
MMRYWVQSHLVHEYLTELPADAHPKELAAIQEIINAERNSERGSLMTELAIFRSQASMDSISLPRRIRKAPVDLHAIFLDGAAPGVTVYSLLFEFYSNLWLDLSLQRQFSISGEDGLSFIGDQVARSLPFICKDGLRYGCMANRRSTSDTRAFMRENGIRVPIQFERFFVVQVPGSQKPPHICAIICRFHTDDQIPHMPWDL